MGKYNELIKTTEIVKEILINDEKARNSDNYLNYLVLKKIGEQKGIDIDHTSIMQYLMHLKEWGFPSFETIRRTRQKIQAECPELAANSTIEGYRMINEKKYREYARQVK